MKKRVWMMLPLILCAVTVKARTTGIPAGTHVTVRLNHSVSSATAHSGEAWRGVLTHNITVDGRTLAHAGDEVRGKVSYAKSSGRLHEPGQISLRLSSIKGEQVFSTRVSRKGKSHTKSNVTKIGGGAAGGALIGGLVGGGKGAAVGAGVGAGAGTGVAAATGKEDVTIPAESVLTFTITGSK